MTRARSGHAAWRVALFAVATVALVLVLAVASHPLWLGPAVTRYLTAKAGREVHFDTIHVGLDGAMRPVLRFSGVRIANVPWADPAWPLADLREAVMVLSWRSLFEERRVIERFVLRDGRVDLERLADGTRNWRLRDPENRGAGRYRVRSLEAERATLRFAHHGIDLAVEVASTPSAGDPRNRNGDALPVQLAFTGAWRGQPLHRRRRDGARAHLLRDKPSVSAARRAARRRSPARPRRTRRRPVPRPAVRRRRVARRPVAGSGARGRRRRVDADRRRPAAVARRGPREGPTRRVPRSKACASRSAEATRPEARRSCTPTATGSAPNSRAA